MSYDPPPLPNPSSGPSKVANGVPLSFGGKYIVIPLQVKNPVAQSVIVNEDESAASIVAPAQALVLVHVISHAYPVGHLRVADLHDSSRSHNISQSSIPLQVIVCPSH